MPVITCIKFQINQVIPTLCLGYGAGQRALPLHSLAKGKISQAIGSSVLSTVVEHSRTVSSTCKNVPLLDCFSCLKIFLRTRNNHVVLKIKIISAEHA